MMLFGQDTARHCGCRIIHEVSVNTVVLRIHAGLIPERPSRDAPVQFMLTVPDVDKLVEWLGEVRKEMVAGDAAADKIIQLHQRRTPA
jgi:hypothetical protein